MKVFRILAGLSFLVASAAVAADGPRSLDLAQLDAVTAGSSLSLSSGLAVNPLLGVGGIGGVGGVGGIGGPFGIGGLFGLGGPLAIGGSLVAGAGGEVATSNSSSVTSD